MTLDDEVGLTAGRQELEPPVEELVEGLFPDPDGRVRPDQIEPQVGVQVVGRMHLEVVEAPPPCVLGAERTRPLVHVDGDHSAVGGRRRQRDCDRSVPATNVGERTRGRGVGDRSEQDAGPEVDAVGREGGPVGDQFAPAET